MSDLQFEITAYLDEDTQDGKEALEVLRNSPCPYLVVPMSGVPEVTFGVGRFIGKTEITTLVQHLNADEA